MKKNLLILFLCFFVKTGYGQVTFQKTYGGTRNQSASSVQRTADGGYIMVGSTTSFGAGSYDVYLVKTDAYGNLMWAKSYGGNGDDVGYFVQQTYDGGYIVAGESSSFGSSNQIYLLKTDANGNLIWSKTFGGTYYFYVSTVYQTLDSGYILSVTRNDDAEIIKTDSAGNIIWTKVFNNTPLQSFAFCIKQNSNGDYVMVGTTGNTSPGPCGYNILFIKISASGNLLLQKRITCGLGVSFFQTSDGGYILLANTEIYSPASDIFLVKLDSAANLQWIKIYNGGGGYAAYSFTQTDDNGYFVIGKPFAGGIYAFKTDNIGNISWSNIYGSITDVAYSVDRIPGDGYIIAGSTYNSQDSVQFYLIKTDINGNSGCNQSSITTTITIPSVQVIADTLVVSSDDTTNIVVTMVDSGGIEDTICFSNGIKELNKENNGISLFPNPVTNELRIQNAELRVKEVEIYDAIGQEIFNQQPEARNQQQIVINVSTLPKGIYFVKIADEQGNKAAGKFVKM